MRNSSKSIFYMMLYFRPIFVVFTKWVGVLMGVIGVFGIIAVMMIEFKMSILIFSVVCLIIPFAFFVLRRFYDQLLFKLNPPDHVLTLDIQ